MGRSGGREGGREDKQEDQPHKVSFAIPGLANISFGRGSRSGKLGATASKQGSAAIIPGQARPHAA